MSMLFNQDYNSTNDNIDKMKLALIDFQGFIGKDDSFIIKELAIIDFTSKASQNWIFQPPKFHAENNKVRKTNNWLTKYFHGINWEDGEVPYQNANGLISSILNEFNLVFVKGKMKQDFLRKFETSCNIIDLSNYGCPRIRSLSSKEGVQCFYHRRKPVQCARYKVFGLNNWLSKNINIVDYKAYI